MVARNSVRAHKRMHYKLAVPERGVIKLYQ